MTTPDTRIFCTIVTRSYLPHALALATSLRSSGNSELLHILVVDRQPGDRPNGAGAVYWSIEDLPDELSPKIRYYFDAFELCNALKPFLVDHLFRRTAANRIIYLDSDIYVTGSFGPVWEAKPEFAFLATPHHLNPPPLGPNHSREIEIVDLGIMNGGFSLWRKGPAADDILAWLKSRLPVYGFCDPTRRMYVDQKLLPLLLAYFPATAGFLHDPCLNVAYWNAHERAVTRRSSGSWSIGDNEVVFFHLSGFRAASPTRPSAYLTAEGNREVLRRSPWMQDVLQAYHRLLPPPPPGPTSYPYNRYKGIRLNPPLRRLLYDKGDLRNTDLDLWKIRLWIWVRAVKRLLTGVRPLT